MDLNQGNKIILTKLREGIVLGGEPYALKGARTVRKGVHFTGFLPY